MTTADFLAWIAPHPRFDYLELHLVPQTESGSAMLNGATKQIHSEDIAEALTEIAAAGRTVHMRALTPEENV